MKLIKPLSNEFKVIQNNRICDEIETVLNKEFKKDSRNFKITAVLFIASLTGCILVGPFFLVLAVIGTGLAVRGLIRTNDLNNCVSKIIKTDFDPNTQVEIGEVNEILINSRRKYHSEYYTDEYIKAVRGTEKIEKQEEVRTFLNKDATMQVITDDIRIYYDAYKLPSFTVTEAEWQMLFDMTYDLFKEKGIEGNFYDYSSKLLRYTLAKQLIDNGSSISIYNFLENLANIKVEHIKNEELEKIKNDILVEIEKDKIIDISYQFKKEIK